MSTNMRVIGDGTSVDVVDREVAHLPIRDEELEAAFRVNLEFKGDDVEQGANEPTGYATFACRAPRCQALYDVRLVNGAVPTGPRNSMLAHLQAHSGARRAFRRVR